MYTRYTVMGIASIVTGPTSDKKNRQDFCGVCLLLCSYLKRSPSITRTPSKHENSIQRPAGLLHTIEPTSIPLEKVATNMNGPNTTSNSGYKSIAIINVALNGYAKQATLRICTRDLASTAMIITPEEPSSASPLSKGP